MVPFHAVTVGSKSGGVVDFLSKCDAALWEAAKGALTASQPAEIEEKRRIVVEQLTAQSARKQPQSKLESAYQKQHKAAVDAFVSLVETGDKSRIRKRGCSRRLWRQHWRRPGKPAPGAACPRNASAAKVRQVIWEPVGFQSARVNAVDEQLKLCETWAAMWQRYGTSLRLARRQRAALSPAINGRDAQGLRLFPRGHGSGVRRGTTKGAGMSSQIRELRPSLSSSC